MSYETDFLHEQVNAFLAGLYESMEDDCLVRAEEKLGRELTDSERQQVLVAFAKFQTEYERCVQDEMLHGSCPNPMGLLAESELSARLLDEMRVEMVSPTRDWWTPKIGGGIE